MSGFYQQTSREDISYFFNKFGNIEKLEYYNRKQHNQIFCFIRFYETENANRAKDSLDLIKNTFGHQVKISMSDFLKRDNIVGDHIHIKHFHNKLPILFISFRETGAFIPGIEYYRKTLFPFGKIVNFCYRPSNSKMFKSFILFQMESIDVVMNIREFYNDFDKGQARRIKLGGKDLEVNILSEAKEAVNLFNIVKPNIDKNNRKHQEYPLENMSTVNKVFTGLSLLESNNKNVKKPLNMDQKISGNDLVFRNDLELCWSGILSFNNPHSKLIVDLFLLKEHSVNNQNESYQGFVKNMESILNIQETLPQSFIPQQKPSNLFLLVPSNSTHLQHFSIYQNSLIEEKTVGKSILKDESIIFILPFTIAKSFYPETQNCQFLCVCYKFNSTESVKQQKPENETKDKSKFFEYLSAFD